MSFDTETRRLLANAVGKCRRALREDVEEQLRKRYGMYGAPDRLNVPVAELSTLSVEEIDQAQALRDLYDHFLASENGTADHRTDAAYNRVVMETCFTILNRLVALRMCEERGYVVESVRKGMQSQGFRVYHGLVGNALGSEYETYRAYLGFVFDELAVDLPPLFDRSTPQSAVFPSEGCLGIVLQELNSPGLAGLLREDETIGWVYQYFNDADERKEMRTASRAPRNSREMAVRNQFFTPRYVVEFLVDNTLGRTWIEMRKGRTELRERCQYLLKRTDEVFLDPQVWGGGDQVEKTIAELVAEPFEMPGPGDEESNSRNFERAWALAHQVNGYRSPQWENREESEPPFVRLLVERREEGYDGFTTQELLESMFLKLRLDRMSDGPYSPDPAQNPNLYSVANEVRRRMREAEREGVTKEEMLALPFVVPFRAEKDPRDLKVLDPACGSGHFLLYAYDLLEAIYLEAWNSPAEVDGGSIAPASETTGSTLREDYPGLDDFRRALPGLILSRNLYGVDIDPRAAQIAALALWLRAQRTYQEMRFSPEARPSIERTNVIVAEPMPGEEDLKQAFLGGLRPLLLGQIVDGVFEAMRLAGEAGVLLRVEQTISEPLAAARAQWEEDQAVPDGLFPELAKPRTRSLFDLTGISGADFWSLAEGQILEELNRFANQVESADPQLRRLFARDAARGFGFIDLCRVKFDVIVMNPPFGDPAINTRSLMEMDFQDAKNDVLQAFLERSGEMLLPSGMVGSISSRTPFFLSGSQDFRQRVVLRLFKALIFADLGGGVMDAAMVEAAAYVLRAISDDERRKLVEELSSIASDFIKDSGGSIRRSNWEQLRGLKSRQADQELSWMTQAGHLIRKQTRSSGTVSFTWQSSQVEVRTHVNRIEPQLAIPFIKATGEIDKSTSLLLGTRGGRSLLFATPESLSKIPGTPFAYWVSDAVRSLFQTLKPFCQDGRTAKQGLATTDDFRFVRAWWEVDAKAIGTRWFPFAKGGKFSPFYADLKLCVDWYQSGAQSKAIYQARKKVVGGIIKNPDYYFKPGLTYPLRLHRLAVTPLPSGSIISVRGSGIYSSSSDLFTVAGLLSSSAFDFLLKCLLGRFGHPQFDNGAICKTPIPKGFPDSASKLGELAAQAIDLKRSESNGDEVTRHFQAPRLYQVRSGSLAERAAVLALRTAAVNERLTSIQSDIDETNFLLYAIPFEDRESIQLGLTSHVGLDDSDEGSDTSDYADEASNPGSDIEALSGELFSWLVGVAFGRWNEEFITRLETLPDSSNPFKLVPVSPPGMLKSELDDADSTDGILVDDPGNGAGEEHQDDVVQRIRAALRRIHEDQSTKVEDEIAHYLHTPDLRLYLQRSDRFFAYHLNKYSLSNRRAPIYWPLSTRNGSYTVWIYYPHINHNKIYKIIECYVRPKMAAVERLSDSLNLAMREGRSLEKDHEQLSELRTLAHELREFHDELFRVAESPYKPRLDDGVVINAAPLRKLFRYKPWVKELDDVWKKLETGGCDWSQMAMNLWPKRVRGKCVQDRSLAIAHGLEDLCEVPDTTIGTATKSGRKKKDPTLIEDES